MSGLLKNVSSEVIDALKKDLNKWSIANFGDLEKSFGEKIKINTSKGHLIQEVSLNSLHETRQQIARRHAAQKSPGMATSPRVAKTSINIWSFPTPDEFKNTFASAEVVEPIDGTQFYTACVPCSESGKIQCADCNGHGKLICGDCEGSRKVDCDRCNGYGFLNCSDCDASGVVDESCPACDRGDVKCNGCGGRGSHTGKDHLSSYDCHLCNGSGKARCIRCGGAGYETSKCRSCNNGQVPCNTCKTQKQVQCPTCDIQGNVTCAKCKGTTKVTCQPCSGKGGFLTFEEVTMNANSSPNSILLSPIENLTSRLKLSLKRDLVQVKPTFTLDEVLAQFTDKQVQSAVSELHSHVNSARTQTHLLEQFTIDTTIVVELDFDFEGTPGKLLYDVNSKNLHFEQNPLAGAKDRNSQQLESKFKSALAKDAFEECKKCIEEAKTYKLNELVSKFQSAIDQKKRANYIKQITKVSFLLSPYFSFGAAATIWLIAGFIYPASITLLLGMLFVAAMYKAKPNLKPNNVKPADMTEIKKNLSWMAGFLVALLAVNFYFTQLKAEKDFSNRFKSGVSLGVK